MGSCDGEPWYLVAWVLDEGWRTVRADRITPHFPAGPGFGEREVPGGDVGEFVTASLDRGDPPGHRPCRGEVLLDAPAALIARWAPDGAVVEVVGPRRCRLSLGAWPWACLAGLIGTFDCAVEVVGPPELTEAFALLGRRFEAAARGAGGSPRPSTVDHADAPGRPHPPNG